MLNRLGLLKNFRRADTGAVTADWVVLTAVIVGLAIPIVAVIKDGNEILAIKISTSLENRPVR